MKTLFELYLSLFSAYDNTIKPLQPNGLEFVLLSQEDYKRAEHNSNSLVSLNDWIIMDLKVSCCIRDYALLCCKRIMFNDIFSLMSVKTQELYFNLLSLCEFTQYAKKLKLIFCIRYAVRIEL